MSQEPTSIESGLDGTSYRTRVNEALATVASTYLGPIDPNEISGITVEDGFQWIDNNTTPWEWKVYVPTAAAAVDGWLTVFKINATSGNVDPGPYLQSLLDAKLPLAGGTMTGKITLDADPVSALHAATKQYVDNTSRPAPVRFMSRGVAEIASNLAQVLVSEASQFDEIHVWSDDAPVGADLTVLITRKRAGSGDVTRSATVLDGTNSKVESVTALALQSGDRLQVAVTGVGSTTAGGNDLLVTLPLTA